MTLAPAAICLDPGRNRLVLRLRDGQPAEARRAPATIDVGEGGRLLAIEAVAPAGLLAPEPPGGPGDSAAGAVAIELERQPAGLVRSAAIEVDLVVDAAGALLAVEVPRRGAGYELTYPSGNQ